MNIATGNYYDTPKSQKVLSKTRFGIMKTDIKNIIDTDEKVSYEDLVRWVLVDMGYAADWGATGADIKRAMDELSVVKIQTPAVYEDDVLITPAVTYQDYKVGTVFTEPVEE